MVYITDLNKLNVNDAEVSRELNKILGYEISSISRPCYYPKLIKYKENITRMTHLNNIELKKFSESLSPKYKRFNLFNESYTVMLINMIVDYSRKNKTNLALSSFIFMGIKFYSSMLHILFPKFCSDELWKTALARLSIKHLFKTKNGVSSTVTYLSTEIYKKYEVYLKKPIIDEDTLFRIVYELRHRIAQSLKSFAELYYKLVQEQSRVSSSEENSEENDVQLISDKISMSICTFSQVDKNVLENSIKSSGINRDIANTLISEISTVENRNQIRFLIILISRVSENSLKKMCIESKRIQTVKRIILGAKEGKYILKDEIQRIIYSQESAYRYKSLDINQLIIFFCHYLTGYIRSKIC